MEKESSPFSFPVPEVSSNCPSSTVTQTEIISISNSGFQFNPTTKEFEFDFSSYGEDIIGETI